jgi:uncharacterized protein
MMSRTIDLRLDFPRSLEQNVEMIKTFLLDQKGGGLSNYRHIFGPQWAAAMGTSMEEIEEKRRELSPEEQDRMILTLAEKITIDPGRFVQEMDKAGIDWGLCEGQDNDETAKNIAKLPGRLKGMAVYNPFEGKRGVQELDRAVQELGFAAVYASPYRWGIKADDPRFYPCYARAAELKIPVFIYTAMTYRTDYPMDIGRPLHLDRVAMDFPEVPLVASCGGWPWVPELVGVARRHQNVYIDFSSHRPKYLAVAGSGFDMLLQFGSTLLQDRVVFASGAGDLGLPLKTIVEEIRALPLKEEVKEKWLYQNALRLFETT